jgi:hypothetical protein
MNLQENGESKRERERKCNKNVIIDASNGSHVGFSFLFDEYLYRLLLVPSEIELNSPTLRVRSLIRTE